MAATAPGPRLFAGLGFDKESSRPAALELKLALAFFWPKLSFSIATDAVLLDRLPGGAKDNPFLSLPDFALARVDWRPYAAPGFAFDVEGFGRWTRLTPHANEWRAGLILGTRLGRDETGLRPDFFLDLGYSFVGTRYSSPRLTLDLYDWDPLLKAGLEWRLAKPLHLVFDIASYSDEEASFFFRSLFEFSTRLDLDAVSLSLTGTVVYSDFFTETAYIDGFSVRAGAAFRL
jgi:hypothetical protein